MSLWQAVAMLAALAGGALLGACGRDNDLDPSPNGAAILVLAAADLRFAFEEMQPAFEQECSCKLTFSFGSSGTFAAQIEQGIPADAYFSANIGFVEGLDKKELLETETKQLYAIGRIVLAKPAGSPVPLGKLEDLTAPEIKKLSIANPDHAPYGVAAREALQAAGLWDILQPKIVFGENASQASRFVETKDADAGIVPLSLAITRTDKLSYVLLDESLHNPLRQGAAVLKSSRQQELASSFIAYVVVGEGRKVMDRYGFVLPEGGTD